MRPYAIAVDLGGTNLRIAAVDERGQFLEKLTTETQVARGRDFVIDEMTQAIRRMMERFKAQGELRGIGIGVPGIIDMATGMLRESPNLPGWSQFPVQAEIERRLGTPVVLENDANAAALGEHWLGAAKEYPSMGMLTLGTGVGGGIVLDAKIWHGLNGMAGELGHINVIPEGHPCGCGSHGCLEQYASATAIVRMAREAIAGGDAKELARLAEREGEEFNSRKVFALAMQGDEPARQVFERMGRALGLVLAGLVNALNLPIYVLGGGAANAWDAFAPAMMAEVRRRSFVYAATVPQAGPPPRAGIARDGVQAGLPARAGVARDGVQVSPAATGGKSTVITLARLGGDAGLYGAARLPLQRG
jgi:glucokinase